MGIHNKNPEQGIVLSLNYYCNDSIIGFSLRFLL